MAILRTFTCDIPGCLVQTQEKIYGQGPENFGQFVGIVLNGVGNPYLCPGHRAMVADFVDCLEGPPETIDIGASIILADEL